MDSWRFLFRSKPTNEIFFEWYYAVTHKKLLKKFSSGGRPRVVWFFLYISVAFFVYIFDYCFIPLLHLSQRRTISGSNFVFSIFLELAPHGSLALFWSRRCHGFLGDRWLGPKSPWLLMTVMTILRMNLYVVAFAFVYLALSIPDGHLVLV